MNLPLALLLTLSVAASSLAQERLLPPTFRPGFEYVLQNQQHLETTLAAGLPASGKQVVDVSFELINTCRANPGDPSLRDVTIQLSQVRMSVLMGGIKMDYDSSNPEGEETLLGQTFKSVIGKSFQITLDPSDNVTAVSGMEEFAAAGNPFGQQFGPEQLTQIAMPMLNLGIPEAGVAPGDSWEHHKDASMGPAGNLSASFTVTHSGEEGGEAILNYRANLDMKLKTAGGNEDPKSLISMENGEMEGTMSVNQDLRFPSRGSAAGSLTMTLPNPLDPSQTLRLPVIQNRSFELVRFRQL